MRSNVHALLGAAAQKEHSGQHYQAVCFIPVARLAQAPMTGQ